MSSDHPSGSGSFVSIKGHPIHPMLIPFPITFLVSALLTDLAYLFNDTNTFWADASFWLLGAGVVSGILAGLTGIIEAAKVRRARKLALTWIHGGANALALVAAAVNWALRWGDHTAAASAVAVALSVCVVIILGFTGWLGGEMTFRHGIGVSPNIGVGAQSNQQAQDLKARRPIS